MMRIFYFVLNIQSTNIRIKDIEILKTKLSFLILYVQILNYLLIFRLKEGCDWIKDNLVGSEFILLMFIYTLFNLLCIDAYNEELHINVFQHFHDENTRL